MTTAVLLIPPYLQFFDVSGNPLNGGKIYTYSAGTTTPKSTYTDATGTIAASNPVTLDSAGRCQMWGSGAYKFVVKDSLGNTLETTDNVTTYFVQESAGAAYFQSFSGDAVTVAFTCSQDLGTDEKAIYVWVDAGVGKGYEIQAPSAYTINGVTLTFGSAPASGTNNIYVSATSSSTSAAAASAASAAASATAAAASALAAASVRIIESVVDHGADPTGATDSSTAFAAARDAAIASGCNIVYLPLQAGGAASIYKISSVDAKGVQWLGADKRNVTVKTFTSNASMFSALSQGASFENIGFDGQKSTMTDGFPIIGDAADVTIKNNYFKNTPKCAVLQGNVTSTRWKVHGNLCENVGGWAAAGPSDHWPMLPILSGDYNELIGNVCICTDGYSGYGLGLEPNDGNPRLQHTSIMNNTCIGCSISVDALNQEANTTMLDIRISGNYVDATGSYAAAQDFVSGSPIFVRNAEKVRISDNIFVASPICHYQGIYLQKMVFSTIKDNDFYINPPASGTSYIFKAEVTGSGGKVASSKIIDNDITNLGSNVPTWLCAAVNADATSLIFGGGENYGNVSGTGDVNVPTSGDDRDTHIVTTRQFTSRFNLTPGTINSGITYNAKVSISGLLGDMVQVVPITDIGDGLQITSQYTDVNEITVFIRNITGGNISVNGGSAVNFRAYTARYSQIVSGTSTNV